MKKVLKYAIFALVVMGYVGTSVSATISQNFAGSTDSNWHYVVDNSKHFTKDNNVQYAAVNWTGSNKENHKLWFRVVNSVGEEKGKANFNYLTSGTFGVNAVKGLDYYLQARREFIIDPSTYVSGNWAI